MTINIADNTPRVSYSVAEGVTQTSFVVSFEFFDAEDLNVYVDGTLKALTTDYTVTGGDGNTGSISISVTGASGGSTVVITRDIALERTTDFPLSGSFQIQSLNTELDRITAIAADLQDEVNRSLRLTDYDSAVSLVLPDVDTRKGKVLAFNGTTGAVESGPSVSDTQSVADASADIATLADIQDGTVATNAITTAANISSNITTVAGIASNVSTVAGISSDVSTVAADTTDIGTVAANISNVNTVAGQTTNMQNVTDNLTAIQNAATNATNASTSASNAATSESNAASSASSASSAQTAAESARDATLAAYDSFDDRYLGVKASDPTLDNDGNALVAGTLYFNSTDGAMKLYNGSAWVAAYVSGADYLALSGGTMTGDVTYGDSVKAIFGAGSDLQIYHNASHSYIDEQSGTGNLIIRGANVVIDDDSNQRMATFTDGGYVGLRYNGSEKLATTSGGIDVTGTITFDGGTTSADLNFGDSDKAVFGAGSDLSIYHNGTHSFIAETNSGGNLYIDAETLYLRDATGDTWLRGVANDRVELYHNGSEKLRTTSYGLDVSGSVVADTHNVSSASGAYVQNFDTYQHFKYEMSGNVTLNNPTTEKAGQSGHMIFIQDATGGRTLSLGTDYETVGGAGITLSSAPNATDIVPYVVLSSGRILLGTPQLAFA